MSREAMQMALEALEQIHPGNLTPMAEEAWNKAITTLRQALETEPFEYWSVAGGWVKLDEMREHFEIARCGTIYKSGGEGRVPLYTAPKQWVGLTLNEAEDFYDKYPDRAELINAIDKFLEEKNT